MTTKLFVGGVLSRQGTGCHGGAPYPIYYAITAIDEARERVTAVRWDLDLEEEFPASEIEIEWGLVREEDRTRVAELYGSKRLISVVGGGFLLNTEPASERFHVWLQHQRDFWVFARERGWMRR